MAAQNKINLPFGETIKRSFLYTVLNGKLLAKMLAFGLVLLAYEIWSGFINLQALAAETAESANSWQVLSGNLLYMLVSVAVMVNYCRFIVLKAPVDFGSLAFFKRVAILMLAMFVFIFSISVPLTILFSLAQALASSVLYLLVVVLGITFVICLSPMYLYFTGLAVEDKNITLKEAFSLTKGNYNKIFWGAILMRLPCLLATLGLGVWCNVALPEIYVSKLIFSVVFITLSLLDTCFAASYFSHVYQYFTFFKKEKL